MSFSPYSYNAFVLFFPTFVKERDLELALPSYYRISYNATGTITVAVNREALLYPNTSPVITC